MVEPEDAPKVLLLGGTSESEALALALARAGYWVLVSTATDEPLPIGAHPHIHRRCGRLGVKEMHALLVEEGFAALVDATHPYATEVHDTAHKTCEQAGLPYLRFRRQQSSTTQSDWIFAKDHEEAARIACEDGRPVLLTTGSRNLSPYVQEAGRRRVELYARVLHHDESVRACEEAELDEARRIYGRGPFSYEDNCALIRRYRIGVMVSKESGETGGVIEKWRAAQDQGCRFIVIRRPQEKGELIFQNVDELVRCLSRCSRSGFAEDGSKFP